MNTAERATDGKERAYTEKECDGKQYLSERLPIPRTARRQNILLQLRTGSTRRGKDRQTGSGRYGGRMYRIRTRNTKKKNGTAAK